MKEKNKFYSDIRKYEIINLNDGERYGPLLNHDLIIDEYGNFKYLIINDRKSNGFLSINTRNSSQIPWNLIKKIGTKTILIDVDNLNERIIDSYIY